MRDKRTMDLTEGVIWKKLIRFFLPILFGTFFQQLYNTVDTAIVGRFVGSDALACVGGSAAEILNLLIAFFVGLSSGATVVVSQFFGAKDEDGVSRAIHTAMTVALIGGAILMICGYAAAYPLLKIMNTPAEILDQSALYIRIVILGAMPSMIYNFGSGVCRALGDSTRPLIFLICSCILNIILDLVFVVFLKLEVRGVATATALAQLVSAVLVWINLARAEGYQKLRFSRLRADRKILLKVIKIGLPTGLQSDLFAISNMTAVAAFNGFGTAYVASWVVLGKIDGFYWMINQAFGVAVMTFVGQNYGACKMDRVRRGILTSMGIQLVIAWTIGAVCLLFGRALSGVFTKESEIISITYHYMCYLAPFYWVSIPIHQVGAVMRGMGDAIKSTIISAVGICGLRVVWLLFVLPRFYHIDTVLINYPLSWFLTSLCFVAYLIMAFRTRLSKTGQ